MGRIKTKKIKRAGKTLIQTYRDKFTADFESNKEAIKGLAEINSKKIRNSIAGYVTRAAKRQE